MSFRNLPVSEIDAAWALWGATWSRSLATESSQPSRTELVGGKWLGFGQDGTPASTNELLCCTLVQGHAVLEEHSRPFFSCVGLRPDLDESWWLMHDDAEPRGRGCDAFNTSDGRPLRGMRTSAVRPVALSEQGDMYGFCPTLALTEDVRNLASRSI